MEVATPGAAIKIVSNAMAGNAFNNTLLVLRLPSSTLQGHRFIRPSLRALPSEHDDGDMSVRLDKPDQKLEWAYADFSSSSTTVNPTYHNKYSPHHHCHIINDLQGRMKAHRVKCERQVVYERLSKVGRPFYADFAEYVSSVWLHNDLARKYYHKALTQMEMDASSTGNPGGLMAEYAEFAWKALGNGEEANRVYSNAVKDYPEDVQLVGSYASFLWELSNNN